MNVIFAGQAGVTKEGVIHKIAEYAREKRGWREDLTRTEHKAHILPLEFEAEVKQRHGAITTVLDSFNNQLRTVLWHDAFETINGRIQSAKPEHVFLSLHLSLYRHSNYFTFTDWGELRRFAPDMIITLIDDVYDVWARIRRATARAEDRTLLTLKELFAWRSVECFFAEQLSKNLFAERTIPHFIVAVKHPAAMFDQLIFEPGIPCIYASYPISAVRDDPVAVQEINDARESLHEVFTVFDPVTIDERILIKNLQAEGELPETKRIQWDDRWPLSWEKCASTSEDLYPIEIPTREITALGTEFRGRWKWQDIDDNIRWRDFALINQSRGVFTYRPCYGKRRPSRGVSSELAYALDTRVIPCQIYSPEGDGDFLDDSPFSPTAFINTDFESALANLRDKLSMEGG